MNKFCKLAVLVIIAIALIARWIRIENGLPYYSIDENDILEHSLSFLAGDWNPNWFAYGPLTAYIYAIIFGALQSIGVFFSSWDNFFYSAFYDSSSFYHTGRFIHSLVTLTICAVAVRFAYRHWGSGPAWIALIICSAPLLESVSNYTIRIDTFQSLWVLLAVYFAANFDSNNNKLLTYALAGIFLGLSIATKPLPGLLVGPAILYAHFSSTHGGKHLRPILTFVIASLVAHSLANPYSVINIAEYFQEQYSIITASTQGGTISGWNFEWLTVKLGWPLAIALALTLLGALQWKDRASRILLIYVATFCGAYLSFSVREYWYIAVLPAALILLARLIYAGITRLPVSNTLSSVLQVVVPVVLIIPVFYSAFTPPNNRNHAALEAEDWIEKNIPQGAPILTMGWYSGTLPRLVNVDINQQAQWAEYFMYGRGLNEGWVEQFKKAHEKYVTTKQPAYQIKNIRQHYISSPSYKNVQIGGMNLEDINNRALDRLALSIKRPFIITAGHTKFAGEWEKNNWVKLLARFEDDLNEVKIFALQPPRKQ